MTACWVLTDGAAGNIRQAQALAERLADSVRSIVVGTRAPWSWLAPHLTLGGLCLADASTRSLLVPPWPDLVVGCGRTGALFTRLLRERSGGACHSVQILDPRADPHHWDVVIAPIHDQLHGDNVITPLGSLHSIDDAWLAQARATWSSLGALPSPRVGMLIGGPRHGAPLDVKAASLLLDALHRRLQREGGSLMLVASRRTPPEVKAQLAQALEGVPGLLWRDEADGPNPYPGVLAWADRLVVSADSVNMLSEACAVGCPVHAPRPRLSAGRLLRFHEALRARGYLHDLDEDPLLRQTPLRETADVAREVALRLGIGG